MYCVSLVTWNRRHVLDRVLDAILATTRQEAESEGVSILVTDQNSTDGTGAMLAARQAKGELEAWLLPENVGIACGRNTHWARCIGHDAVRMDDKVEMLTPGWLSSLRRMSDEHHAIVGIPYHGDAMHLWQVAPLLGYVGWRTSDNTGGGPLLFVPGALSRQLGAWDELPGVLYGWEDNLYYQRAAMLGWNLGLTTRLPLDILAMASEATRARSLETQPIYEQRLREYVEGERDVDIPIESTAGHRLGLEAK